MANAADPECLFCKIAAGKLAADRAYEDDEILAFKDIHPQAPFHWLVIPKAHVATLNDFDPEHAAFALVLDSVRSLAL